MFLIEILKKIPSPKLKKLLRFQEGTFQARKIENNKYKKSTLNKFLILSQKKGFLIFQENGTIIFRETENFFFYFSGG